MTAKLWGSSIRRESYAIGKPAVVERFATRPWPVDPAKYPLSGPSSGPAYCPPTEREFARSIHEAERMMKENITRALYADTNPQPRRVNVTRLLGWLTYFALAFFCLGMAVRFCVYELMRWQ